VYCSWPDSEVGLPRPKYAPGDPETNEVTAEDKAAEDKAFRVYNKAEVAVMNKMLDEARELITAMFDDDRHLTAPFTARFSRKAGCSCSCSPGLILTRTLRYSGGPIDIWLERTHDGPHHFQLAHTPGICGNSDMDYYKCQNCQHGSYRKNLTPQERYEADPEYRTKVDAASEVPW
jgi:hypothetical protein